MKILPIEEIHNINKVLITRILDGENLICEIESISIVFVVP